MAGRSQWLPLSLVFVMIGCSNELSPTIVVLSVQDQRGFVEHEYRDSHGTKSKYIVFVPENFDPQTPSPAILFLHGAGQTGSDGERQAQGGLGEAIRARLSTFPFIVVFPQSKNGSWLAESPDGKRAIEILEEVENRYNVDSQRIYLTGYSMGGEGTWSLAGAHPHKFAAIVPICPGKNSEVLSAIHKIPCWCFQGARDDLNRLNNTRSMMLSLQKSGGRPIYQEYPDQEHNCWDAAYNDDDIFQWLLQHSIK